MLVFCISTLIFILIGGRYLFHCTVDFFPVYTGARCLLHGCNPYDTSQLDQQFFQAGGHVTERPVWTDTPPVYPPSTFIVISPLALFRIPVARLLWSLMNVCLFVTSAGLILSLCPQSYRWFATTLVSLILASSGMLLSLGNPAIFSISLLVIGSYLFLRDRNLRLGAILLMLSIAVKPQIGGLIVLYLLVRGIHRRYAVAAIAGALALLLSAGLMLSLQPRSADWTSALRTNISAAEDPGGVNDSRPTNKAAYYFINLQAITGVFFTDAREYNSAAWAIFLALLAVWIAAVLRANAGLEMNLLSIGALAVLSLMPVYHRYYDARLLLISIPAVLIVYQRRRLLGACIGALTIIVLISVQSRLQAFIVGHAMWQSIEQNKILFILLLRQQNLELTILFCLYLVAVYSIRFSSTPATAIASPAH